MGNTKNIDITWYPLQLIKTLLKADKKTDEDVDTALTYSLAVDGGLTFKIVLWYRTQTNSTYLFRRMLNLVATYNPDFLISNLHLITLFGDSTDLLVLALYSCISPDVLRYMKHIKKYPEPKIILKPITQKTYPKRWLKIISKHYNFQLVNGIEALTKLETLV